VISIEPFEITGRVIVHRQREFGHHA
jgi:hypothetical protein